VANSGAVLSGSNLFVGAGTAVFFGGVEPAATNGNDPDLAAGISSPTGPSIDPTTVNGGPEAPLPTAVVGAVTHRSPFAGQVSFATPSWPKTSERKGTVGAAGPKESNATKARDAVLQAFSARRSIGIAWVALSDAFDAQQRSRQKIGPMAWAVDEVLARFAH
jgi:hypothetical protein